MQWDDMKIMRKENLNPSNKIMINVFCNLLEALHNLFYCINLEGYCNEKIE